MDFSNFEQNNFLFCDKNRESLLFLKDKNPNDFIKQFIVLRSKLQTFKSVENQEDKKAKDEPAADDEESGA